LPNQIGIVDPSVIEILTGLHLGLDLLDDVSLLDDVMRDLDAGYRGKGRRENL